MNQRKRRSTPPGRPSTRPPATERPHGPQLLSVAHLEQSDQEGTRIEQRPENGHQQGRQRAIRLVHLHHVGAETPRTARQTAGTAVRGNSTFGPAPTRPTTTSTVVPVLPQAGRQL